MVGEEANYKAQEIFLLNKQKEKWKSRMEEKIILIELYVVQPKIKLLFYRISKTLATGILWWFPPIHSKRLSFKSAQQYIYSDFF